MPIGIFIIGIPLILIGLWYLIRYVFKIDLYDMHGVLALGLIILAILFLLGISLYSFINPSHAAEIFWRILQCISN